MKKYSFLFLVAFFYLASTFNVAAQKNQRYFHLLIGTYTKTQDKGLFVYKFDSQTGDLSFESATEGVQNPSYLIIRDDSKKVYAVNESGADRKGAVSAFNFDAKSGKLQLINIEETHGAGPCYIMLSPDNHFVFTANYAGGSISVFPVKSDGAVGKVSQIIQHTGSSINPNRQKEPHVHSVNFSPDGKILYSADLGTDKIYGYQYDASKKQPLRPAAQAEIPVTPGFGPRHFVFNQKGNRMYLVSEMAATITVFDDQKDVLKPIQIINLMGDDFRGINGAAAVHFSQDGKFLYATNRGNVNKIVIFKVDEKTGKLTKVGETSTLGEMPRDFIIDPTDHFLLIAHQNSNDIFIFKRNQKTGLLTYINKKIELGSPVCLKMTPLEN